MKQNHCPLSQNLRMAAGSPDRNLHHGQQGIPSGDPGRCCRCSDPGRAHRRRCDRQEDRRPQTLPLGEVHRKSAPDASGSENQVEHPLLTFLFRQFNKPFHPLNRYKNPLYRFFISIYHKKYHFLLSNTTTQNCLFSKSFLSTVSFLNSLHQNFISNCIQSIEGV